MATGETRSVVITGVSRGLGLAMAEEFARLGHTIYGCARDAAAIAQLRGRFPSPHAFQSCDVSVPEQVEAWASNVMDEGGPPDLLLNNAALINENAPLWEVPVEDFSRLVDVNIKGIFLVLRCFLPAMIQRGRGVIVNFSSGWGRSTSPQVASYCASKWAIEGLTRALAQELPRGMAAVPFSPGVIHTDMLESCMGGSARSYQAPDAWARKAVPFLLSLGPKDNGKPLTAPG